MINRSLEWFGDLGSFSWKVGCAALTRPFELREIVRQFDELGSKSLPLVALAGAAVGTVLALESRSSLARFGAKSMLPAAIVFSIVHEMGPVVTGLVVSGRVGAGIGAELGSMKVTEQIDAIEASAVNPYKLLAFTRILACIVVLPLLTLVADFFGVFAGWITATLADPIPFQSFLNNGSVGRDVQRFSCTDVQNLRLRADHRPGGLLSRDAHARRHRRRRALGDECRRAVVTVRDCGGRHPREADSDFLPMKPD